MKSLTRQQKLDMIGLVAGSINAQMVSLMGQLEDFEFLEVSDEQFKELNNIEIQLHLLVNKITNEE